MVEQRTGLEFEASGLGPIHIGAGEITGQQIRRELDPLKIDGWLMFRRSVPDTRISPDPDPTPSGSEDG